MLEQQQRSSTIKFLRSLQGDNGLYADSYSSEATLQTTLSGVKALQYLGISPGYPDKIKESVMSFYDKTQNAFIDAKSEKPNVFVSAAGLLILYNIGAKDQFDKIVHHTLEYMSENANIREEHFMTIGVVDECQIDFDLSRSIKFFKDQEIDGKFGNSILNNAIASSALLRIGVELYNLQQVIDILLSSQTQKGGFAEINQEPNLWTTYCVMRTLDLDQVTPKRLDLFKWIMSFYKENGGFGIDDSSANLTYQCLSILDWIVAPIFEGVKYGDNSNLSHWISEGGNSDVYDLKGFTPLLIASARGENNIVEYLISECNADPKIKYIGADASPLLLAGQSGDLQTVQHLLSSNPIQLYEISKVNGHNVLLQAAFYGSEGHYKIAEWIFNNIKSILKIDDDKKEAKLLELTRMTNVRGYNCTTMNELWGNKKMGELFKKYDRSTEIDRTDYLDDLLESISNSLPEDELEQAKQELTENFIDKIENAFQEINDGKAVSEIKENLFIELNVLLADSNFDINRKGGPLAETPIIVAITGVDKNDEDKQFRLDLTKFLLDNGADPDLEEEHPMAVDAVIRAAVLNHFSILKLISEYMPPLKFAAALNSIPAINGQTALQDTVHRALTAEGESLKMHLEQISWAVSKGARTDIEDHTGKSPEKLAKKALNDRIFSENAKAVIKALNIK